LRNERLEDTEVRTIPRTHRESSRDACWRGRLGGAARTSPLILEARSETQCEIRAAFDRIFSRK
jgi:hypothetical protein